MSAEATGFLRSSAPAKNVARDNTISTGWLLIPLLPKIAYMPVVRLNSQQRMIQQRPFRAAYEMFSARPIALTVEENSSTLLQKKLSTRTTAIKENTAAS